MMRNWVGIAVLILSAPTVALADEAPVGNAAAPGKVVYKKGKDVDFEALLIQGQLQRPEMMVVTGDPNQGLDGLLRLRENFLDRMTADTGGEIQ